GGTRGRGGRPGSAADELSRAAGGPCPQPATSGLLHAPPACLAQAGPMLVSSPAVRGAPRHPRRARLQLAARALGGPLRPDRARGRRRAGPGRAGAGRVAARRGPADLTPRESDPPGPAATNPGPWGALAGAP